MSDTPQEFTRHVYEPVLEWDKEKGELRQKCGSTSSGEVLFRDRLDTDSLQWHTYSHRTEPVVIERPPEAWLKSKGMEILCFRAPLCGETYGDEGDHTLKLSGWRSVVCGDNFHTERKWILSPLPPPPAPKPSERLRSELGSMASFGEYTIDPCVWNTLVAIARDLENEGR